MNVSRRSLLKGLAGVAGGAIGTRLAGRAWEKEARADNETPALVIVYIDGGFNALFTAADSLMGTFGVAPGNVMPLGNGLVVDAPTFGTLPDVAKQHMAAVGVRHGISDHEPAKVKWFSNGTRNYALMLANELGGEGAIKAAAIGTTPPIGATPPENGVSLQTIADMNATISALGGGNEDPRIPSRAIAAAALERSAAMSKRSTTANPSSLKSLAEGYPAATAVLRKPVRPFSFSALSDAYGLNNATAITTNFNTKIAAAELMIEAGANVVTIFDTEPTDYLWDTHFDTAGYGDRELMNTRILPSLRTFLQRMLSNPERNVVVAMIGDFARTMPDSAHAANCAAAVFGRYVNVGTTAKTDPLGNMAAGTPDVPQFWSYLASVLKAPTNPFGENPHRSLVVA